MHRHIALFSSVCLITLTAYSTQCNAGELTVNNGWIRMPPPVSDSAAAYLELQNKTTADVHLTAITCDAADMVMLHQTQRNQNKTTMVELNNMLIPAESEVKLTPGDQHIMLSGLHHPLRANDEIYIQLHFSDGSTQQALLEVRDIRTQVTVQESGVLHMRSVRAQKPGEQTAHMEHMH